MSFQPSSDEEKLPIHGFVLAGGKSSRMGTDKALLPFRGRPMVEIAVEKLGRFCSAVSIAGNREDLSGFAPVVPELRVDCGPAAGVEAGLRACTQPWALFIPVDVPLVPAELLKRWAVATTQKTPEFETAVGSLLGCSLYTEYGNEPAFCMLRPEVLPIFDEGLPEERRLSVLLGEIRRVPHGNSRYLRHDAAWHTIASESETLRHWFSNVNTAEELAEAEFWAEAQNRV